LPAVSQCLLCHRGVKSDSPPIRTLARYGQKKQVVPWVRLYRAPDYVFFSHARHLAAKIDCAACHGPVPQRDVLEKEVPTNMQACMDCHRTRSATLACNACHELGQ